MILLVFYFRGRALIVCFRMGQSLIFCGFFILILLFLMNLGYLCLFDAVSCLLQFGLFPFAYNNLLLKINHQINPPLPLNTTLNKLYTNTIINKLYRNHIHLAPWVPELFYCTLDPLWPLPLLLPCTFWLVDENGFKLVSILGALVVVNFDILNFYYIIGPFLYYFVLPTFCSRKFCDFVYEYQCINTVFALYDLSFGFSV